MSHFYGTIHGQAGEATRRGSKASGVTIVAASWSGAIQVQLWYDAEANIDRYTVSQIPWHGSGYPHNITEGIVGAMPTDPKPQ